MRMRFTFGTLRIFAYHDPLDRWSIRAEAGSCDAGSVRWWGLQIGRSFALVEWSAPVSGSAAV